MPTLFRSRWIALAALLFLLLPLLIDAVHHLFGIEMHLGHSARLHHWRALAPVIFAMIALAAFLALAFTRNRWEQALCCSVGLWFTYECIRFIAWLKTHHLLHGPFSWIFWIPAVAFLSARTRELFLTPQSVPQ